MPSVTYERLLRTLRDPAAAGGVFFLLGDEEFLREQAAARVVHTFLDPATRDFNLDQLRGAEADADALASIVATPPMMATYRVVVVRDAQGLSPRGREVVEAAAKAPPQGLVLVVMAAIPSGSKAKFYDELKRAAVTVEFAAVTMDDAPDRLMELARTEHGLAMEPAAARALVAGIGTDLGQLSSELRKLADYVADRAEITADDVRAVGGVVPRQDRWAWFDLFPERRWAEALSTLPVLLSQGEGAVGLVIGITGPLLRVGLVCAGGPAALERELKPYQRWMVKKLGAAARRWTLSDLDAALGELLRTDRLLKSASLTDQQAMEELILRLWALDRRAATAA